MISAALKLAASRAKALVPAGTGAYVGSKMAKGRDRLTGRNRRAPPPLRVGQSSNTPRSVASQGLQPTLSRL